MEKWIPIKRFENYEVSSLGGVRDAHSKNLVDITYRGKEPAFVVLSDGTGGFDSQFIHRLVAKAFIPNPKNHPCVIHTDGNKLNNTMENLMWGTYVDLAKEGDRRKHGN